MYGNQTETIMSLLSSGISKRAFTAFRVEKLRSTEAVLTGIVTLNIILTQEVPS